MSLPVCAWPAGCPNRARYPISWREGPPGWRGGVTWACEKHVEEVRKERVDAGCSVMGGVRLPDAPLS
jgi:hypothetical protein